MAGTEPSAEAFSHLDLPAHALRPLVSYLACLDAWAARINLTGARTAADRIRLLVAGIVPLAPLLLEGSVLDIGSGNGSPGLVLAALRPELPITLLEPRQRRWAFLRDAARAMGRNDVDIQRVRHDGYRGQPAVNVVVRALALPLHQLAPLTAPGGQLMVIGRTAAPGGHPFEDGEPRADAVVTYRRRST